MLDSFQALIVTYKLFRSLTGQRTDKVYDCRVGNNRSIGFAVTGFFVGAFISLIVNGLVEPDLPFGAGTLIAFGVGAFGWIIGKESN